MLLTKFETSSTFALSSQVFAMRFFISKSEQSLLEDLKIQMRKRKRDEKKSISFIFRKSKG